MDQHECSDVRLIDGCDGVTAAELTGFHKDWSYPMPGNRILAMLRGSTIVVVARRGAEVIGYAAAISDGAVFAYLTSVEVRESCRGRGIGGRLVNRVLERCRDLYAVDLCCDAELEAFYRPLGFQRVTGMCVRNRGASGRVAQ